MRIVTNALWNIWDHRPVLTTHRRATIAADRANLDGFRDGSLDTALQDLTDRIGAKVAAGRISAADLRWALEAAGA